MFNLYYPLISDQVYELLDFKSENFKNEGKLLKIYEFPKQKSDKDKFNRFFDQFNDPIPVGLSISKKFTCEEQIEDFTEYKKYF